MEGWLLSMSAAHSLFEPVCEGFDEADEGGKPMCTCSPHH